MKKDLVLINPAAADVEVYAREGYTAGSYAVWVECGFATGSEAGVHHAHIDDACVAELGTLQSADYGGEFLEIPGCAEFVFTRYAYTLDDAPNRNSAGMARICEGWTDTSDSEDVDWDDYQKWVDNFCESVLP